MTYQIIITEETSANIIIDNNTTNVSVTTTDYPITINYNAVIEQAGGNAYGNANVAAYLASSSLTGNIITSANISGAYILGNGSQLTGLPATYGNANVAANLAAFGSNPISTTGNITGGYILGNGSQLTGMYSNANVQAYLPTYSGNIGELTITGNLTVTGTTSTVNTEIVNVSESVVGNVDAGNLRTTGQVSATGNISSAGNVLGAYLWGDGGNITGVVAGSKTIQIPVKNTSGGTLTKGTPVYATGTVGATDVLQIAASRADTASTMPAIGLLETTLAVNDTGYVIAVGALRNYDTSAYTIGQTVYVGATGGITTTRPNNGYLVQPVGTVGRVSVGSGSIEVNSWNYFQLPNLGNGNIWLGNATASPVETTLATYTGNIGGGNISASGNVTAAYHIGNGSTLSSITGANVSGTVANATYALNANAATYSTQATFAATANSVAGANVSGTVANATYATSAGSATTATTANTVTDAAQANITSVGTLTSLSVSGNITGGNLLTPGQVSATGNVRGGNVLVPINGRYYGDFTTGTASGRTVFQTTATGTSSATNLTAVPGNNHVISNTAFSSGLNLFANGVDVGNSAFGYVRQFGNRTEFGTLAAGTGTVGNLRFSAGSAQIYLQNSGNVGINNADPQHGLAVNGNTLIAGNLSVTGNISNVQTITATGNITTGNLVIAPGTGAGNIDLVSSQAMTTVTTTNNPGRIIMGSGYTGNSDSWSVDYDPYSRMRQSGVLVNNRLARGDGAINTTGLVNVFQQEFTANITTASTRNFSAINFLHVGGGSSAYQANIASPAAFVGMNSLVVAGTQGNVAVGNVTLTTATGGIFGVNPQNGASVGNAFGVLSTMQPGGATGNIINAVAFAPWTIATSGTPPTTVPTDYNVFYNPGSSAVYGSVASQNWARSATNYYAFKNDDDVAQVKLGSLRSYNEFQYSTATSGTVNIDKTNAQVQFLSPTANVTIGDFQNFVTTASDSVNNDNQTDTVTLIIQQGATPYTVTMPTGNASIKYAGGVSTIGTTANAVTMVSISAIRSAANATLYLASVSSEFS